MSASGIFCSDAEVGLAVERLSKSLQPAPQLFQGHAKVAADENRPIILVRHDIGAAKAADELDRTAQRAPAFAASAGMDNQRAIVAARTPEPVLIVPAQRRRQAVFAAVN